MDKKETRATVKNTHNNRGYIKPSTNTKNISQALPKGTNSPLSAVVISLDIHNHLLG